VIIQYLSCKSWLNTFRFYISHEKHNCWLPLQRTLFFLLTLHFLSPSTMLNNRWKINKNRTLGRFRPLVNLPLYYVIIRVYHQWMFDISLSWCRYLCFLKKYDLDKWRWFRHLSPLKKSQSMPVPVGHITFGD